MAGYLLLLIVIAAAAGFYVNWRAAQTLRNGGARLHSMTAFHGAYAALIAALPALLFVLAWLALRDGAIMAIVTGGLPDAAYPAGDVGAQSLVQSEIRSLASGSVFGAPSDTMLAAADRLNRLSDIADGLLALAVVSILGFGLWRARRSIAPQ
ncbi:MAG: phosphate ABC transporter permease subunit PstC, partial [Alphaproteobacteria bacterium HGW-Alphaproteobacteria-8]